MEEEEEFAAAMVEQTVDRLLGRGLGPRTRRDARDESGLRVDFTYEHCEPRVALEITGLHVVEERQVLGEAEKRLEDELAVTAEEHASGTWVVVLDRKARVKDLLPELKVLVAEGVEIRPNDYTSQELKAIGRPEMGAFVRRHRRLHDLGLVDLILKDRTANDVGCMVVGGGLVSGFGEGLDQAIEGKRSTLAQAVGYQGHLGVIVHDIQASRDPLQTQPPALPPEISHLWVIHTWPHRKEKREVWLTSATQGPWSRCGWA